MERRLGQKGGQFVSEPIVPVPGTSDARAMSRGEPGLPARFTWRGREYKVVGVLSAWKTSSTDGGGPTGALYLRRHWYKVATQTGEVMTLYCQRQAADRRRAKSRWWLYAVEGASARA